MLLVLAETKYRGG